MSPKPFPLLFVTALLATALFVTACGGEKLYLAGSVERTALELAAPVSELIVELPVAVGTRVQGGDVVVRLDTEVAEAELRAHEAAHAAALAAQTEADGEFARAERLTQENVSTRQSLDNARRKRDEAFALVAEKNARIAQAKKRLRDLTITTFAAGVVDQLPYEVGERVPAGGVVAVVIADEKPWVRVWLPSRAVALLSGEVRVEVDVEGYDDTFTGRLEDVARESEFTPHYALTEREGAHLVYESRVVLEDAPADLRPGLPAQVRMVFPGS